MYILGNFSHANCDFHMLCNACSLKKSLTFDTNQEINALLTCPDTVYIFLKNNSEKLWDEKPLHSFNQIKIPLLDPLVFWNYEMYKLCTWPPSWLYTQLRETKLFLQGNLWAQCISFLLIYAIHTYTPFRSQKITQRRCFCDIVLMHWRRHLIGVL